jgi:hypothetical protein
MRKGLVVAVLLVLALAGSTAASPAEAEALVKDPLPPAPEKAPASDDGAWETPYQNGVKLFDPDDGEVRMSYQTVPMPEPAVDNDAPAEEGIGCDHPWCCTLPGHIRGHYCLDALFWQTFVPDLPGVPDDEGSYCYHVWHYGVLGCDGNYIPGLAPYWLGVVCYGQGECGSGEAWCYVDSWSDHCGGCWCD